MSVIDKLIAKGKNGFVILEPREIFDGGIVGYDEAQNRLIYGYDELCNCLATSYQTTDNCDFDEAWQMAMDWVEYNTLRSISYMGETKPIILLENENGELVAWDET